MNGPIQPLFDWVDQNGPAPDIQARFAKVEILGKIASVHLELEGLSGNLAGAGVSMSDVFTLMLTRPRVENRAESVSLAHVNDLSTGGDMGRAAEALARQRQQQFEGMLLTRTHDGYEGARRIWKRHDRSPARAYSAMPNRG